MRLRNFKLVVIGFSLVTACSFSANSKQAIGPSLTEVWQPAPSVVDVPENQAPSDAIVLFNGSNLSAWSGEQWTVVEGVMSVKPGAGDITTRQSFSDVQLHIEWRSPEIIRKSGQHRGNSGIFFQDRYELQILDSYNNRTYANGQAGSIYKQHIPLVNVSRAPGEWQSYDVIFNAPRFKENGTLISTAFMTVLHNGVLIQNHVEVHGRTVYIGEPSYSAHGSAPITLQNHGAAVSYRNIWLREL